MTQRIDYYFSPISPWTYFGGPRLAALAERCGAEVVVKPVDYSRIFPVSGGLPLGKRAPQRQAYRLSELARWRDYLGMPLNLKPAHFPAPDGAAARLIVAARLQGLDALSLSQAILRAVWAEERNIADAATLQAIATEVGMDGAGLLALSADEAVEAKIDAETEEAIALGVFGAPTYVLNGELFWGQDRLDFLERALAKA